ncbi:MAG: purine-nucleoside phosphorylase [Clostridiales bacterium]|nr:purine-nucleoside phosphorylase [Clostridiales bacterium]
MEHKLASHREQIFAAAAYLRSVLPSIPQTAVILGSGLGPLAAQLNGPLAVDYREIPGFVASTAAGHSGRLVHGALEGQPVLVMQGRFHCYEGYDVLKTVFPVRVFAALGVKNLLVSNAAGGINPGLGDGALMLITDHIALFADSPLKGANLDELGPRFPDMTRAYDRDFQQIARQAALELEIRLFEGVYAYAKGPQYETPAEVRALAALGADAVGMSTVAEVTAARHCGMKVIGLSCITNMAAGIIDKTLNHEEVLEVSWRVSSDFCRLVTQIVKELPKEGD